MAAATSTRPHPNGVTVWFTGLPSAGKTTVANLVAERLAGLGRPVEVLDGDVVRTHLSKGLGFSRADRDENIRRIGYVAGLLTGHGVTVLVSAISPYRAVRDEVRAAVERVGGFVEVHVATDLATCRARDVKGLYARQARGELKGLTGVDDPYEPPLTPELVLDTAAEPPEASAAQVLALLDPERAGTSPERAGTSPADGRAPNREGSRPGTGGRGAVHSPQPHSSYPHMPDSRGPRPHGGRLTERLVPAERAEGLAAEAKLVFETDDPAHPGVAATLARRGPLVGGPVHVLRLPATPSELGPRRTPAEVRSEAAARGWRSMAGFQTRNPVHRAHEYLHKVALEHVDGLLLHPLVGQTKDDDVPAALRMACYRVLLDDYYPAGRVLLSAFPAAMRYAGPREAIFHALVRKNYGCTHFIVGRDHAGVGSWYGTYAAQEAFDAYDPGELGITPLKYEHAFFCRRCEAMATSRTCPHPFDVRVQLSGTAVRDLLARGQLPPPQFSRPAVAQLLADGYRARGG